MAWPVAAASGGGQFVAVGAGAIITSPNASSWSPGVVPSGLAGITLRGVAGGGGQFVAVGGQSFDTGVIFTSPDGTNWSEVYTISNPNFSLNGASYDNGRFVVVGDYGMIFTSPDGTNWTTRPFSISSNQNGNQLEAVAFGIGNQFIVVGEDSTIVGSAPYFSIGTFNVNATGVVNFALTGLPGINLDVEATSDFNNWSSLGNAKTGRNGSASVSDPSAPDYPVRFYRAKVEP
jgi:hypothetical protein